LSLAIEGSSDETGLLVEMTAEASIPEEVVSGPNGACAIELLSKPDNNIRARDDVVTVFPFMAK
jgi:hypothetical protein